MISLLFISFAAICNAIMDVCSFHWHDSVFNRFDRKWWDSSISWKNKYINSDVKQGRRKILDSHLNYPVQFTDAWHFFKMLMLIFIALAIITYEKPEDYLVVIDFILIGFIWNLTFSVYYKKILRKK